MKKLRWAILGLALLYLVNTLAIMINNGNLKELMLLLILPVIAYEFSVRHFEFSGSTSGKMSWELIKVLVIFLAGILITDSIWLPQTGLLYWIKYPLIGFASYKAMLMHRSLVLIKTADLKDRSLFHQSDN